MVIVGSNEAHQRMVEDLSRTGRPAVIVAGSGMGSGGRIVKYLTPIKGTFSVLP